MSKLQQAYITTADTTFKKVKSKDGKTMHFKDGTPISENAFNAGQANLKFRGEKVKVAVPSNKGPGYIRKEVNPIEASSLGQEINFMRNDVPGEPRDTVIIDGEKYDIEEISDLNDRITERHGSDAVFKYN